MSDWQPIETAPTDGTTFIAWSRGLKEPVTVRWIPRGFTRPGYFAPVWYGETVIDAQSDWGTEYKEAGPLALWTPMPTPPTLADD